MKTEFHFWRQYSIQVSRILSLLTTASRQSVILSVPHGGNNRSYQSGMEADAYNFSTMETEASRAAPVQDQT